MPTVRSDIPRLMIAAPRSNSGKTTLSCALLQALLQRNLRPAAFKCGPDYIDPLFHREALGISSHNLDLFFLDEERIRGNLAHYAADADIAILEGVMGFYDGIGGGTEASSWHLACVTDTPVLLVADPKGMSISLAALLKGFQAFRPQSRIAAVVLNNCSESLYQLLQPMIEAETGLKMLGYLPPMSDCSFSSRHLGLSTDMASAELQAKLSKLAAQLQQSLDIEALLTIAASAKPLQGEYPRVAPLSAARPRIAVARDAAFCFYYPENLEMLEALGAETVFFSPLSDEKLPDCQGLYLGGGYPELHAAELSANGGMLRSIEAAHRQGLPILAECGGFMYLHQSLEGADGQRYPLCNILPAAAYRTSRLQRFGYARLSARRDTAFCRQGVSFPVHEFHYWDSEQPGDAFLAAKPASNRSWSCTIAEGNLLAGFPHLYFPAAPQLAENFVSAAAAWQTTSRKHGTGDVLPPAPVD